MQMCPVSFLACQKMASDLLQKWREMWLLSLCYINKQMKRNSIPKLTKSFNYFIYCRVDIPERMHQILIYDFGQLTIK